MRDGETFYESHATYNACCKWLQKEQFANLQFGNKVSERRFIKVPVWKFPGGFVFLRISINFKHSIEGHQRIFLQKKASKFSQWFMRRRYFLFVVLPTRPMNIPMKYG